MQRVGNCIAAPIADAIEPEVEARQTAVDTQRFCNCIVLPRAPM